MIHAEREHKDIDRELIRNIIQTYVSFDTDEHRLALDTNRQMLDIYQKYFEEQFLQDTVKFYRSKIITYLQEHSVPEYILKIPQFIDEEIYRVTFY
ncbi:hypothetical protein I4U23_030200 [Adineta vaga]|nr:hypothetical protein I4U23_030200 [Adineta vaga]